MLWTQTGFIEFGSGSSISSESGSYLNPRFSWLKNELKKYRWKMLLTFFDQKLQFTNVQATEKAYPALLKIKFINFFLCLRVIFALLDPDLDCKGTLLNPDPIRIRIHNSACKCTKFHNNLRPSLPFSFKSVSLQVDWPCY